MTAGPTHRMTTETAGADGPVIYVVDDDKAIRLALGALLRSVGLGVEVFESPDEFLRFPHFLRAKLPHPRRTAPRKKWHGVSSGNRQ
jgi:hypothetical protein